MYSSKRAKRAGNSSNSLVINQNDQKTDLHLDQVTPMVVTDVHLVIHQVATVQDRTTVLVDSTIDEEVVVEDKNLSTLLI